MHRALLVIGLLGLVVQSNGINRLESVGINRLRVIRVMPVLNVNFPASSSVYSYNYCEWFHRFRCLVLGPTLVVDQNLSQSLQRTYHPMYAVRRIQWWSSLYIIGPWIRGMILCILEAILPEYFQTICSLHKICKKFWHNMSPWNRWNGMFYFSHT